VEGSGYAETLRWNDLTGERPTDLNSHQRAIVPARAQAGNAKRSLSLGDKIEDLHARD